MSIHDVNVHIACGIDRLVPDTWLEHVASEALMAGEAVGNSGVSVMLADDKLVKDLNSKYRGLDEHTDVLSFAFDHQGEYYGEHNTENYSDKNVNFILPPGEDNYLGDVIISLPQVESQSVQAGHSVEKELAVLLIHGILHLLGHDHEDDDDAVVMKTLESNILENIRAGDLLRNYE